MTHGYLALAEFCFGAGIVNAFDAVHEYAGIAQLYEQLDALDGIRDGPITRAQGGFGFIIGHGRLEDKLEDIPAHVICTTGDHRATVTGGADLLGSSDQIIGGRGYGNAGSVEDLLVIPDRPGEAFDGEGNYVPFRILVLGDSRIQECTAQAPLRDEVPDRNDDTDF